MLQQYLLIPVAHSLMYILALHPATLILYVQHWNKFLEHVAMLLAIHDQNLYLIEVLVAVGILLIMFTGGLVSYRTAARNQALEADSSKIIQTLRSSVEYPKWQKNKLPYLVKNLANKARC